MRRTRRRGGFQAGTAKAKLAGQLAKYARAHLNGDTDAKKQARNAIAVMVGVNPI